MELHELKVKVFTELVKVCNYRHVDDVFEITVDDGEPVIFFATVRVNAYWSGNNYEIKLVSILKAGFQHPDFETKLPKKYILEIEKFCEDTVE